MSKISSVPSPKVRMQETQSEYIFYLSSEVPNTSRIKLTVPWVAIIVGAILLGGWALIHRLSAADVQPDPLVVERTDAPHTPTMVELFQKSGFVFPDSDRRLLTKPDIAMLSDVEGYSVKELVRFSINELYARNHYRFTSNQCADFYGSYDWYSGYLNMQDAADSFNEYEQKNLNFLVSVENQLNS